MKPWTCIAPAIFLGSVLGGAASARAELAPILLHPRSTALALPVAAYRHLTLDEFRQLVVGAFETQGFSLNAIEKDPSGTTRFGFVRVVPTAGGARHIMVAVRADENLDRRRRCASCFLRLAELPELSALQQLPWRAQYEIASAVIPAIDQAFARIRVDGSAAMDGGLGFNYSPQWRGERNLYDNSFTGIDLTALKRATIDAYRGAGFDFVADEPPQPRMAGDAATHRSTLVFSFPVEPRQPTGVVYRVMLASQLDDAGACDTCEMREDYDPYQTLPSAGWSAMTSRLTLESRFATSRLLAFERLKAAADRYLRPRSVFAIPPQAAPLGSPRPRLLPPAVT